MQTVKVIFFGNIPATGPSNNTPAATTVTPTASIGNKTSSVVVTEQKNNKPATTQVKKSANKETSINELPNQYPQPSLDNVPYYYNQTTNTLSDLEKVNYTKEKVRKGAWGRENIIILPGALSNVQLSKKQGVSFIIHFDKPNTEPFSSCVLNTTEVNDKLKRREWVETTSGAHGTQAQHDDIQIKFKQIGPELYLVTLDKNLKTGELFFMIPSTNEIYSFGYSK